MTFSSSETVQPDNSMRECISRLWVGPPHSFHSLIHKPIFNFIHSKKMVPSKITFIFLICILTFHLALAEKPLPKKILEKEIPARKDPTTKKPVSSPPSKRSQTKYVRRGKKSKLHVASHVDQDARDEYLYVDRQAI
ncbi:hypothetical protein O181_036054 [Austropuccinia psidii MF-1]|uniref:Transmembrane protein n=1 Tax=Austropuccinia psidii MF-1 TaxID=1389203 RepID=A0A9Q3D3U3_9BASI|nr:hypothetical protein [Austropuccinia psidii MF-1]